jgi:HK97 family phage major capsid protein
VTLIQKHRIINVQKNTYKFELKSLAQSGLITGYCSVFNVIDHHKDLIKPQAFAKGLDQPIKLLWQHQVDQPIGVIEKLTEDAHGLIMQAKLLLEVSKASEAYALIKAGIISALSIGFNVDEFHYEENLRIITKATLWEVSLVTFAANEFAKITNVKQKEPSMTNNQQYAHTWENFKEINDRQAEEISKTGAADPLTALQLKKLNQRLDQLEASNLRPNHHHASDQDYQQKSAFAEYLRYGEVKNLHEFQSKSLSVSAKEDGGYLVTSQLSKKITTLMQENSIIRQLAGIETISTDALDVIEDLGSLGAGWVSETQTRPDTDTTQFGMRKIMVHELYAQPKATQKLIDDARIDIEKWLCQKLVEVFSAKENDSFINGDGVGKPRGILNYAAGKDWGTIERVKSGDKALITADSIFKLYYALRENYAAQSAFLLSPSALQEIRMLKDSTSGRYLCAPSLNDKAPATLMGRPVYVSAHLPELAPNSTSVIFADFAAAYKIVDRFGLRIMRDPFTDKPFVKFYATKRVGGDVVNFKAIKLLQISA